MAGTNLKNRLINEGPVIILAEPQLGENIGMVARAMANFGLGELRLVNPRDGWPNEKALTASSGALSSGTSNTFTIAAGSATALGFAVEPTTTNAGSNFNPAVRVAARDAQGNVATSFGGSVTVAVTGGTGTPGAGLGTLPSHWREALEESVPLVGQSVGRAIA